ncbi:tRNA modification GTPase TrmE [Suillus subalutaceus]|uniref:tRNA modification GTPase TrmE n=1 Tax=Suillus subalutaceus TaxID=48586 RepID=UPI001B85EA5C|nr:tRNA modification GTPase TrmE [Suillus subalutaceus]KAG1858998.1 tRNA modification GTPase TrmE [Suillus subalutaceus]
MLRQWRASITQKAVKDPRIQRRQVQFRENNSLLISNLASVVLHRNSPWNCRSHRPNRSSWQFDATGYTSHTHTTLSVKSEPTLSDAQRRTIYALSTPPGKAGIAVIRVSGPNALDVWRRVTRKKKSEDIPTPWMLQRRHVVDPETEERLDDSLTVFFKGPKSFTTEDTLELHIHSGRAVLSAVLRALAKLPYCRPAVPGEFTRRAFEGGRLDLTQVEGLRDLIDAETEAQRRVAVSGAEGTARAQYVALRSQILECLVFVEGFIDFGEDVDDLGQEAMIREAHDRALNIINCIRSHLDDNRRGEILRSGIKLAIFGPPNAGKSSLFNFLAQRDAAITSPIPGTTRDVLTLTLDIGGFPVVLSDTAGLRETLDTVEQVGVGRAGNAVKEADVSLCVLSLPDVLSSPDNALIRVPDEVKSHLKPDTLFLLNKSDTIANLPANQSLTFMEYNDDCHNGKRTQFWTASLRTSEGTQSFLDGLAQVLRSRYSDGFDYTSPLITHARHRDFLEQAVMHLEEFIAFSPSEVDIAAESLRYAARAIGSVSGLDVGVEEVLGGIFSSFCVGK